jgi:putative transposase
MISFKGRHFQKEMILQSVRWYLAYALSSRDIEEILAARGIVVSYDAIRRWWLKFGQHYANRIRHRRGNLGDTWNMDEVFVTIRSIGTAWTATGRCLRSCPRSR